MYEKKGSPLLTRGDFLKRMLWHTLAALALIMLVFLFGVLGQVAVEDISLHDAFLNTALLLGGIGTHSMPQSIAGKLFIATYGFVTGLLFIASIGVILAPVAHRIMHKFHLDED
ncbi:two pore domain potassium channel family protein [Paenalcaligenes suwonensis]|uniref:two pore domain potassium channel family protein n=1 Tax=Paenalcaligenes suwonensis TaxID=1202713 RepID=UPI00140A2B55|nr:two pore domain potassium channel family protein [Paenalcaligenes suwonensis]NHC61173.1 two pore domain potassium channel family protein [Paenalcaligenes suwonensis]